MPNIPHLWNRRQETESRCLNTFFQYENVFMGTIVLNNRSMGQGNSPPNDTNDHETSVPYIGPAFQA